VKYLRKHHHFRPFPIMAIWLLLVSKEFIKLFACNAWHVVEATLSENNTKQRVKNKLNAKTQIAMANNSQQKKTHPPEYSC
jgi:hypothetical protein